MFSVITDLTLMLIPAIFIIYLTFRFRLNPFFILVPASFILGMINGVSPSNTVIAVRNGFGATIGYYGIMIIAGTVMAVIMEKSGALITIANKFIRYFHDDKVPVGLTAISGALSVSCPSETAFILFAPIGKFFEREFRKHAGIITISVAVAIYTARALVPPSAGPIAASGILNAGIFKVFFIGIAASAAGITASYFWSKKFARIEIDITKQDPDKKIFLDNELPSFRISILPLASVLLFITLKTIATLPAKPFGSGRIASLFEFLGDPAVAMLIGLFLSLSLLKRTDLSSTFTEWAAESIDRSVKILIVAGAGGAFAAVLKATSMSKTISENMVFTGAGLLLPFLIAASFKILSGSSTVAIITAASLSASFMSSAGLDPAFTVAAVAAGSMVVSHANDPYFWIVSRYTGMDTSYNYRCFTTATLITGLTSFLMIWLLSFIF
jgi:GntP family gluconate:H+ symporter